MGHPGGYANAAPPPPPKPRRRPAAANTSVTDPGNGPHDHGWRMTSIGFRFRDTSDDPEAQVAAGILGRLIRERQLDRYWTWRTTQTSYPTEWRNAATDMEHMFYMTAEELAQVNREIMALLIPLYRERLTDPTKRPPDAIAAEMLVFSYPIQLPTARAAPAPALQRTEMRNESRPTARNGRLPPGIVAPPAESGDGPEPSDEPADLAPPA